MLQVYGFLWKRRISPAPVTPDCSQNLRSTPQRISYRGILGNCRRKRKKEEEEERPPFTSPQAPQVPAHPQQNSAALRRLSAAHTMPWICCSQDALQSVRASQTALQAPRAPLYPAAPDSGCFRGGRGSRGWMRRNSLAPSIFIHHQHLYC